MKFNILSGQIGKNRKYCPNPIIKRGVPEYADIYKNPKVADTLAYHQFWEEQLYFIHNGYQAGGQFIPGRYYKFLNFDFAQRVRGGRALPMEIHDYQLDFALWVDHLKSDKVRMNAFIPKARRKAFSVMTCGMVVDYGWRFKEGYHAAVVAGVQKYADGFIGKWHYLNNHMRREFYTGTSVDNNKNIIAGFDIKTEQGWTGSGSQNVIFIRTVNTDPNVLKGEFLNDVIYEESGENELLKDTISATKDCLMDGNIQYGTEFIFGTGGNVDKGSKDFKDIHNNLSKYNCQEWFVPAYVFFNPAYSGSTDEYGNNSEDVPYLKHMKPHERVGWSDFERAKELIKAKKKQYLADGDIPKYLEYCQNNPLEIEEVFRKTSANNFDMIKINDQLNVIERDKQYNRWHLSFKKNEETGERVIPYAVNIRPAKVDDNLEYCVDIRNDGHPRKGYRYLDVAGLDSYDQNQAHTSKSLGAMVVFRRMHDLEDIKDTSYSPLALICMRPKYKETFYDLCMMLAIYYDLQGSVLIDAAKPLIIKHFQDNGCGKYLAVRPKKYESPDSKQSHDYGVLLTKSTSRPMMAGLLQSLFDYHCEKIHFEELLKQALNWDHQEVDSDNDAVDALGMAMMQANSMDYIPIVHDSSVKVKSGMPVWKQDADGDMINITVQQQFIDDNPNNLEEDYLSRLNRLMGSEQNKIPRNFVIQE